MGYRFKVYPVNVCPGNKTAFETAAEKIKCTGRYLCAPNKDLTNLIEFCTDRKRSLFLQGIFYITHSISTPTPPFITYPIDLKGLLHHTYIYLCIKICSQHGKLKTIAINTLIKVTRKVVIFLNYYKKTCTHMNILKFNHCDVTNVLKSSQ